MTDQYAFKQMMGSASLPRNIFFTGKGGVGKTTTSTATAERSL